MVRATEENWGVKARWIAPAREASARRIAYDSFGKGLARDIDRMALLGRILGCRSLYPELLHPAAQCAGGDSQAYRRAIGPCDGPICHDEGL